MQSYDENLKRGFGDSRVKGEGGNEGATPTLQELLQGGAIVSLNKTHWLKLDAESREPRIASVGIIKTYNKPTKSKSSI